MISATTRRQFLGNVATSGAVLLPQAGMGAADARPVETATISQGDLKVEFRDNSQSPKVLSGLESLVHLRDARDFDAFDPDTVGASAGLNFEHIISGHKSRHNAFAPRHGKYDLFISPDGTSATLVRQRDNDPWSMSSTLKYTVTGPHYIDADFRCVPHDRAAFGKRGYAILFFANYMNDVENVALHFRGIEGPDQVEKWIVADAPAAHPDWKQGGTYRSASSAELKYDADHNFKLNSWSYDFPRFVKPFYYGRAGHGMVCILMFSKLDAANDEFRFSLFKFKVPRFPRPAWDFQYVIREIEASREYGFRARLVWKKFVSPEDCLDEYEAWRASVI